ncbi:MAG TPA: hypothetical protein VNA14_05690 [Mycobacteriales bacterium]|nr:hypothetical protein [Mycobacteriales bacterium]
MSADALVDSLAEHPNAEEIVGVLARMVQLNDEQLSGLALSWNDNPLTAAARARALEPDSPLVLEVLGAFDSLAYLYEDDLDGEADYLTVPAPVAALALKATRDAIAAAYARPALEPAMYDALIAPWRALFSADEVLAPDFGPQHASVLDLFGVMASMACRSHDAEADRRWSEVLSVGTQVDLDRHGEALDRAWDAALLTDRRRLWTLVSRTGQEAFFRRCHECDRLGSAADGAVLALCLGAVVGVMMSDVLDEETRGLLVEPLGSLIPQQSEGIGR